jgi:hypothetical protein
VIAPPRWTPLTRGYRPLATAALIALATISSSFGASVSSSAATAGEAGEVRTESVDIDAKQNVTLVVRLGSFEPAAAVPATAFSVSPRSMAHPLRVTRLGAGGLDLVLAFDPAGPATVLRAVRTAAAEVLLTLPRGARAGIAGATGRSGGDSLLTDTAAAVLALDRVRTDRSIHDLLAEALERFQRSPRVPGRHRALLLFDVGTYPGTSLAMLNIGEQAAASDVAVYVVRLLDGQPPHQALEELAVRTGGLVASTHDPARLGSAYQRVLADLGSRHRLEFRLPGRAPDEVRVTVELGGVTRSTIVPLPSSAGDTRGPRFAPTSLTPVLSVAGVLALILVVLLIFGRRRSVLRPTGDREQLGIHQSFPP